MPVFEKYFYICFIFSNELYFCDPSFKIFEAFALNLGSKLGSLNHEMISKMLTSSGVGSLIRGGHAKYQRRLR